MPAQQPIIPPKASFASSVMQGISGYVKGTITGALAGGAAGALIGLVTGGIALATGAATGGILPALALVGASMASTAGVGALALAALGGAAGLITGVVKSREKGQVSAQDVINVAKVSFAQGVQVGAQIEHARTESKGKFQQAALDERNKTMLAERQVSH